MSSFEELPLVAWEVLYSHMDKESVLHASNVCVSWRKMIHALSFPSNFDSELQDKLEKCGWITSEHDVTKCKCINLKMGLYKFIRNVPGSYIKVGETFCVSNKFCFSVSKSRICYTMKDARRISIIHLTNQERLKTINMGFHMEQNGLSFLNGLHLFDNTLVILENCPYDEEVKIHLLNLHTNECVVELNISEKAKSGYNVGIKHVKLTKNKLLVALNIFDRCSYQFLIWNLDTEDPSTSNFSHLATIDHYDQYLIDHYDQYLDYVAADEVYMNFKLFCFFSCPSYDKLELRVYRFDEIPNFKTIALDHEDTWSWKFIEVKLESGDSGRLAIYDKKFKKIRVYNLDNDVDVEIQVDLSSFQNKLFPTIEMLGFFMNNIIFVRLDHQLINFIIVTEVGDVVNGKTQKIMHHANQDTFFDGDTFGMMMYSSKMEDVHLSLELSQQIHLYYM